MVDIAASLSLTPASLPLDPAAILGAETADNQAFGDILAGQIAGQPSRRPTAAPFDLQLPTLPLPAGNRQPGGNILPGATEILPLPMTTKSAPIDFAVLTAPTLPTVRLAAPLPQGADLALPEVPPAEVPAPAATNPVHALLKMVATAIRTPRQAAADAPAAPSGQDATAETERSEASPDAAATVAATVAVAVPVLPILVAPTLQSALPTAISAGTEAPQAAPAANKPATIPTATAALPAAAPQAAPAMPREQSQANRNQPIAAPLAAPQAVAAATVESVPVLTVATVSAEAAVAPAPAVTLTPLQLRPAGTVTTARIKVGTRELAEGQRPAADPIAASLTPAADRVMPTAMPIIADSQQGVAAAPAAPATTAPAIEMPRQDFAALVERLVEARNAEAPASTHASINHAEFGQVSLHFQQDGGDLKVGMTSADPGFAVAVQAAMPAQNQNLNADSQQRGQSQSAGTSSQSNPETAGQRGTDTADSQGGRGQGRNSRGGNGNSNPSQRWTGEQPQSRGGIFA